VDKGHNTIQLREPGAGRRRLNGWHPKGRCPGGRHQSPSRHDRSILSGFRSPLEL